MSYDFTLFRPKPGLNGQEAYEQYLQDWHLRKDEKPDAAGKEQIRLLAGKILAGAPHLDIFDGIEPTIEGSGSHIELTNLENGIQISIYEQEAFITMPYWHTQEEANTALKELWTYLRVICYPWQYRAAARGGARKSHQTQHLRRRRQCESVCHYN